MTRQRLNLTRSLGAPTYYPVWDTDFGDEHLPPKDTGYTYVETAPAGLFDQESLCPHLITEVRGQRIVVPLGSCGFQNEWYQVAPFHCQTLPQKDINWGFWYPIYKIRLAGRVRRASDLNFGMIRLRDRGNLELYCISTGGYAEWVAIPGVTCEKPAGRIYARWDILIPPLRHYERAQVMVRFDGEEGFENYVD